ncbi:MAG: NAD kinase [Betaproteobacteria bacterium CG2_30_68_42]|nr:MAG: NAD kinase [Betaproteobacteria bacterium CG2_30_68_42]
MQPMFETVALIAKMRSPEIAAALEELAACLIEAGCRVLVEEGTAGCLAAGTATAAGFARIGEEADLALIVGGDGTLLSAARRLADFEVPLVGVNQGRLGFLTDIARTSMRSSLAELLAGRYARERRCLLEAEVLRAGERVFATLALNDVVVNKGELGRMIEFEVLIDGEPIYNQRSDGLIVATPTGSTAYALSASGPILHPAVAGIVLVPLCPHALSNRPIVVGDGSRIEIRLIPPHDARVHCDGQVRFDARAGDCVRVERSARSVTLLHPPGYSYFAMLREKLRWSEAPRDHGTD